MEFKGDEIRRRLETGWTVPGTVVGRDHWPPPIFTQRNLTGPSRPDGFKNQSCP